MGTTSRIVSLLAAVCLLAGAAHAGKPDRPGRDRGPKACDPDAVAAAAATVAAACPCEGTTDATGAVVPWRNHGKYVRCVAQATKAAIAASGGAVARRCVKQSVRCAARSTCGKKEGVVNCTRSTSGTCTAGSCDDGSACASDGDCGTSSCSFRRSAEECVASGGVPGTGSCCAPAPIGSPSGAFVDGVPVL